MLAIAAGCDLEVERGPDCLLVRVRDWDPAESDVPLTEQLWNVLQQHFTYSLVLELSDDALSGLRIEELAELNRRIESRDGFLRICGLSSDHRLNKRVQLYCDRREAVLGRPRYMQPR